MSPNIVRMMKKRVKTPVHARTNVRNGKCNQILVGNSEGKRQFERSKHR
jgi:hypothetical protein